MRSIFPSPCPEGYSCTDTPVYGTMLFGLRTAGGSGSVCGQGGYPQALPITTGSTGSCELNNCHILPQYLIEKLWQPSFNKLKF